MQERRILAYIDTNDIPSSATTDINAGDTFNTLYLPIVSSNSYINKGLSTVNNGPYLWIGTLWTNLSFRMSYCGVNALMYVTSKVQKYINGTTYYAIGVASNNVIAGFYRNTDTATNLVHLFAPSYMVNASSTGNPLFNMAGNNTLSFLGYIKLTFSSTVIALSTVNLSSLGSYPIYIDNE